MSEKQDRTYPRTAADIERKMNYEKKFAEIMGVALDAQKHVEESEALMKAELSLKLGYDDNDQIVSMLNASADIITITGDRLTIDSTYFTLEEDGTIWATAGEIGGCTIENGLLKVPAAQISGILKANQIEAFEITADDLYVEDLATIGASIAKWQIRGYTIRSFQLGEGDEESYYFELNSYPSTAGYWIDANYFLEDDSEENASFSVSKKGVLTATKANITGTINADSGYIGAVEITESGLNCGGVSFDTNGILTEGTNCSTKLGAGGIIFRTNGEDKALLRAPFANADAKCVLAITSPQGSFNIYFDTATGNVKFTES